MLLYEEVRHIFARTAIIGAVILFNSWLLAFFLNRRLLTSGGSISDLTVHDQPHWLLFQVLGVTAGALFAIVGLLLTKLIPGASKSRQVLVYGTLIFGIANIADGLLSLPCSETLDKHCSVPITINWSHFNFPSHGYSSVLIAIAYLALPLAGYFYSRASKNSSFYKASVAAIIVAFASLVSAGWEYLNLHSFSAKASGWAQGVQMLVIGVWFLSLYSAVKQKIKEVD